MKIPNTPFSTRLSGSAKETELRIRSIFQWKKKRPPAAFVLLVAVLVLLCFGLVSCEPEVSDELRHNIEQWIAEYPWAEKIEKYQRTENYMPADEADEWIIERVTARGEQYDSADVYDVYCVSAGGKLELWVGLLVDPETQEVLDLEGYLINNAPGSAEEPYPVTAGKASDLVVLTDSGAILEVGGYFAESSGVSYSLKNEADIPYYIGFSEPSIQVHQDGRWYHLETRTDRSVLSYSAEGEAVQPGETYRGSTDFSRYGDTVPDGIYRLVVAISETPTGMRSYLTAEFVVGDGFAAQELESLPSAAQIREMKAERYAAAIGPYDSNGDGVLQTLEFPHPDPELFGLTGTDAALFSAVSEYTRRTLYLDSEDTMLLLSSVTVYGEYGGENGATHYVCDLWHGMYYDAGIDLAEGGGKIGANRGGGGRLARVTLSADGALLEVLTTQDGENNTQLIYEICGPLTELAETLRVGEAAGRDLAPRDKSLFTRYLGYCFPGTMAVQENIQDLLRHYTQEYSILVLDVDEVTGMVDICLGDYRPEVIAGIKQLVEANYSRSDYLNFEDYTGFETLTT